MFVHQEFQNQEFGKIKVILQSFHKQLRNNLEDNLYFEFLQLYFTVMLHYQQDLRDVVLLYLFQFYVCYLML
jgi:hypothetical protein